MLGQAPPPVRRLPPANVRVPIAELQVPRAADTPEMHRCERVGAWPLILLMGGTLVVLVTSYVVLRVLGFLSWRAHMRHGRNARARTGPMQPPAARNAHPLAQGRPLGLRGAALANQEAAACALLPAHSRRFHGL